MHAPPGEAAGENRIAKFIAEVRAGVERIKRNTNFFGCGPKATDMGEK